MNSDISYYTATKHSYNDRWYATLKDDVLHAMITTEKNKEEKDFLQKLEARITLINDTKDLAKYISKSQLVLPDHGWKTLNQKLAIFSSNKDIGALSAVMKVTTSYIIISSKLESQFNYKIPWFGSRNFFIDLAKERLAWVEQPGIYSQWLKQFERFTD